MQRLRLALILVVLNSAPNARAEPPPPPLPACAASSVERDYQTMSMAPFEKGALGIGSIQDLGVFPPAPQDNQYATAAMFVKEVRFCETVVTLPDGAADPTYWTIKLNFNVRSWIVQTVYCSLKYDVWGDGCKLFRKPER